MDGEIMLISEYLKQYAIELPIPRDEIFWLDKCPCCGAEASLHFATCSVPFRHCSMTFYRYQTAFIRCTNCHIRTEERIIDGHFGVKDTINDVIDDWNKRPIIKKEKQ